MKHHTCWLWTIGGVSLTVSGSMFLNVESSSWMSFLSFGTLPHLWLCSPAQGWRTSEKVKVARCLSYVNPPLVFSTLVFDIQAIIKWRMGGCRQLFNSPSDSPSYLTNPVDKTIYLPSIHLGSILHFSCCCFRDNFESEPLTVSVVFMNQQLHMKTNYLLKWSKWL